MAAAIERSIIWFRKGLRLHDNPALIEALQGNVEAFYPIFILDPEYVLEERVGANRFGFLLESLHDLDDKLKKRKSRLLVYKGNPLNVIPNILTNLKITKLCFESDTEPYARYRDFKVSDIAKQHNVKVLSSISHTLYDPDRLYTKNNGRCPETMHSFSALLNKVGKPQPMAADPPENLPPALDIHENLSIPTLKDLGYKNSKTTFLIGGESEALQILSNYLANTKKTLEFEKPKTNPASLEPDTTSLSSYLKFGCLSPKMFYFKLNEVYEKSKGKHTKPPVSLLVATTNHVSNQSDLIYSTSHDYVIIGGGSAGCVLANRLTENGQDRALSIEAGPKDGWWNWKIHMPAALTYNLCNDKYNWYYHTVPQKNMNDRVMYWPRGRVWGGSSALNAMVYIRGHAYDYDRWENEGGAKGWSYADCLPYFKKSQTHPLGEDEYRGGDGPLKVSRGRMINPLYDAFIEAGKQAGYPYTPDCNGYQQEGVGPYEMTVHNGKRWSTSQAYLRPALKRKNLETRTNAHVTRVIVENSKAVGVEYVQNNQLKRAKANKEVILAGGAINSPQLLMLSGIGDASELKQHGIPCINHLPGVGKNLQDHLEVYIQNRCTQPITLYKQTRFWYMPIIGSQWFLTRTGDCGTNSLEAGGFIRTREGLPSPDIQLHFLPFAVKDHGRKFPDGHAYQLHAGTLRATSRGTLKLKSANPYDHPIMDPNYLATHDDVLDMRECVKLSREIMQQDAFRPFRDDELQPGAHVKTDEEIDAFVRELGDSAYHPSCTCKMGDENDPMSVVTSDTRVKGIENLRVIDASIMPYVVSGNLNGPVVMMAEKAADIIKGVKLPKSTAPVYVTPMKGQR